MKEFVFEIGTEEIPARMLNRAAKDIANGISTALAEAHLQSEPLHSLAAPRQIIVYSAAVQAMQEDREEILMGPPVRIAYAADGAPTKALKGFLRKNADIKMDDLYRVEQPKGEVVAAKRFVRGDSAESILAQAIPNVLASLHFAKSMRWGAGDTLFVRPVRSLAALFGTDVISFHFAGVDSSNTSFGHRFHGSKSFEFKSLHELLQKKSDNHIVSSHQDRKKTISEQIDRHLAEIKGELVSDDALLSEVADLVECPYVVLGEFDREFLAIPREVLVSSLRVHQKSFCVEDESGQLMPFFLSIASVPSDPAGLIKKGNEWVLRARLWDAKFFWQSDLKKELSQLRLKLEHLMFQNELGSYLAKTERMVALAQLEADDMSWSAERIECLKFAVSHAKTDLVSELVFEFPELQGVIGGLLLREQGQPEPVWKAVYDHYLPLSTDDDLPQLQEGGLLALVDKIDTLVGCFSIGLIPTGTKDPYALRRAAQGAIRILMEMDLPLSLDTLVSRSIKIYGADQSPLHRQIMDFFCDRIRHLLKRRGFDHDLVEATLVVGYDRVDQVLARAQAIKAQQSRADFRSLSLNLKRMRNVIADEQSDLPVFDSAKLVEAAELELWREFSTLQPEIESSCLSADYSKAMNLMTQLAAPVDVYFSPGGVYVNVDDIAIRRNRKAMMRDMLLTLGLVGDLSQLEAK